MFTLRLRMALCALTLQLVMFVVTHGCIVATLNDQCLMDVCTTGVVGSVLVVDSATQQPVQDGATVLFYAQTSTNPVCYGTTGNTGTPGLAECLDPNFGVGIAVGDVVQMQLFNNSGLFCANSTAVNSTAATVVPNKHIALDGWPSGVNNNNYVTISDSGYTFRFRVGNAGSNPIQPEVLVQNSSNAFLMAYQRQCFAPTQVYNGAFVNVSCNLNLTGLVAGVYSVRLLATATDRCYLNANDAGGQLIICGGGEYTASTSCVQCTDGTYSSTGSSLCFNCTAGSVGTTPPSSSCFPCYPGAYQPEPMQVSCSNCPAGSFTSVHGSSTCTFCAPGTYTSIPGHIQCQPCDSGYTSGYNATACTACAAGRYNTYPSTNCTACPAGKYSSSPASTTCIPCDVGRFTASPAMTACSNCTLGTFSTDTLATTCNNCTAGHFNPSQAQTTCPLCGAGSYSNDSRATTCSVCLAGSYSVEGQTTCTPCSPGSVQWQTGASACFTCTSYNYTHANTTGATACSYCPSNFTVTSSSNGNIACTACPPELTSMPGAPSCGCDSATCNHHGTCVNGTCTCDAPFAGVYCDTCVSGGGVYPLCCTNQDTCNGWGQCTLSGDIHTQCICQAGAYGGVSCAPCPIGQYSVGTNNTACTNCTVDTTTSQPGSVTCDLCNSANHYYGTPGSCQFCDAQTCGAYGTCTQVGVDGGNICECVGGAFFPALDSNICAPCPPNTYTPPNNAQVLSCFPCFAGTYAPPQSSSCSGCSATIDQCQQCSWDTLTSRVLCTVCNSFYTLNSTVANLPSPQCVLCANVMDHCNTCNSLNDCTSCTVGYGVDSTTLQCVACDSNMPNCRECSDDMTCTLCDPDLWLYDARCFVQCPLGTIENLYDRTCDPCPMQSIPNDAQTACVACPPSTWANVTQCVPCFNGTFAIISTVFQLGQYLVTAQLTNTAGHAVPGIPVDFTVVGGGLFPEEQHSNVGGVCEPSTVTTDRDGMVHSYCIGNAQNVINPITSASYTLQHTPPFPVRVRLNTVVRTSCTQVTSVLDYGCPAGQYVTSEPLADIQCTTCPTARLVSNGVEISTNLVVYNISVVPAMAGMDIFVTHGCSHAALGGGGGGQVGSLHGLHGLHLENRVVFPDGQHTGLEDVFDDEYTTLYVDKDDRVMTRHWQLDTFIGGGGSSSAGSSYRRGGGRRSGSGSSFSSYSFAATSFFHCTEGQTNEDGWALVACYTQHTITTPRDAYPFNATVANIVPCTTIPSIMVTYCAANQYGTCDGHCHNCSLGLVAPPHSDVCVPPCTSGDTTCHGHGECNTQSSSPTCICTQAHFTGDTCNQCVANYYGPQCNTFCNASSTCHARGACHSTSGACVCEANYYGPTCATFCNRLATCSGHGVCASTTGTCQCLPGYATTSPGSSPQCNQCDTANHYYGVAATTTTTASNRPLVCTHCVASTTCNGHGTCDTSNGACVCSRGFAGAHCNQCDAAHHYYGYPTCRFCDSSVTCLNGGVCDTTDGSCSCAAPYSGTTCGICAPNYYNYPACTYCTPDDTCSGHGSCNSTSGACVCDTPFFSGAQCHQCAAGYYSYATNCNTFCDNNITCHGLGTCKQDGTCNCLPGYVCQAPTVTCLTNYVHVTGACVYCTRSVNCSDHGDCTLITQGNQVVAKCQCDTGFTGDSCGECARGYTSYPICSNCANITQCSGNGQCDAQGHCVCSSAGFIDAHCSICNTTAHGGSYYAVGNPVRACVLCDAATTCNGHGVCNPTDGTCLCQVGFTGASCDLCDTNNNFFGTHPNCVYCLSTTTCSSHGSCDVSTGSCVCSPQFVGNSCDTCAANWYGPSCSTHCTDGGTGPAGSSTAGCHGNGVCNAATGKCICNAGFSGSSCNQCDTNYYGYPTCQYCVAQVSCNHHGACVVNPAAQQGNPCSCDTGYTGVSCGQCDVHYYNYPTCVYCDAAATCSGAGTCDNITGDCNCDAGYAGEFCNDCAIDYYAYPTCVYCHSTTTCSGNGVCTALGTCACQTGYTGSACDRCDTHYYLFHGTCVLCQSDTPSCEQGTCASVLSSSSNAATSLCTCNDTRYSGTTCNQCASSNYYNYPTCQFCDPQQTCNGHGTCDSNGNCVCTSPGFIGAHCDTCDVTNNFYPNVNGTACVLCVASTMCSGHSVCDANGACVCVLGSCTCPVGFTGTTCGTCAAHYYPASTCTVFCLASTTCNGHGTCSSQGTCVCDTGYTGADCTQCDTGYVLYPPTSPGQCSACSATRTCHDHGTCVSGQNTTCQCDTGYDPASNCGICAFAYVGYPSCARCSPSSTCSGHGTCDSAGACVCDTGYSGAACNQCSNQYHGYPNCTYCSDTVSCSEHGTCSEQGTCLCDPGFTASDCSQCAPGHYVYPSCVACTASTTCNGNGVCSTTAAGQCVCNSGFTGTWCQTSINYCVPSVAQPNPPQCQNGGVCISHPNTASASCACPTPPLWTGTECATFNATQACIAFGLCVNGGQCVQVSGGSSLPPSVQCVCPSGFSGTHCQHVLNDCDVASNTAQCALTYTCVDPDLTLNHRFTCVCDPTQLPLGQTCLVPASDSSASLNPFPSSQGPYMIAHGTDALCVITGGGMQAQVVLVDLSTVYPPAAPSPDSQHGPVPNPRLVAYVRQHCAWAIHVNYEFVYNAIDPLDPNGDFQIVTQIRLNGTGPTVPLSVFLTLSAPPPQPVLPNHPPLPAPRPNLQVMAGQWTNWLTRTIPSADYRLIQLFATVGGQNYVLSVSSRPLTTVAVPWTEDAEFSNAQMWSLVPTSHLVNYMECAELPLWLLGLCT